MAYKRKKIPYEYYMGDFETTVYENQTSTEVWASAIVKLYEEKVLILHSIQETFSFLVSLDKDICIYYHNLKFDGAFWIDFILNSLNYKQAVIQKSDSEFDIEWEEDEDMSNKSFKYTISDQGQWYQILLRVNNHFICIRDSLKLLPFSVKEIGKAFKTKHQKLDMEYIGYRYAGCEITDSEKEYIANDVLVVKEALEIMFEQGHQELTIGSCCLKEFKDCFDKHDYKAMFPDLTKIELDDSIFGSNNADAYIRKSYKGGWCYLVKGKEEKVKKNGTTADVNSLYPSMMHSESGNRYPVGKPQFWKGNFIPHICDEDHIYYFVRIKTRFYLKKDMLPCIQIKGNFLYRGTEWLETSDIKRYEDGKLCSKYLDIDGKIQTATVTLTLTRTDFQLIKEHYDLLDFEILDGCYFLTEIGIFDEYINKYSKIKMENKGALRTLAKLFLNNLYGKMATSTNSSFKFAFVEKGNVQYTVITEFNKDAVFIAIGSAITSYARNFTIRVAQKNYYGVNKRGFIYADTDSIHCDLQPDEIKGITVHDKNFFCWKLESCWDYGFFTRQKTYIEHITMEDLQPIEKPILEIKCAGMPEHCKELLVHSIERTLPDDLSDYEENEIEFMKTPRTINDFKQGLIVPGKLMPKRIQGGIILKETTYEMR